MWGAILKTETEDSYFIQPCETEEKLDEKIKKTILDLIEKSIYPFHEKNDFLEIFREDENSSIDDISHILQHVMFINKFKYNSSEVYSKIEIYF